LQTLLGNGLGKASLGLKQHHVVVFFQKA